MVAELGVLVGMTEETMINQQAQDDATACSLLARRLGQLAPAFRRLPVRHQHLDEPPQGVRLDHVQRAPGEIRRHQIPRRLFPRIFPGPAQPGGVVSTNGHACTAHTGHHLVTAADAAGLGRTGMGGTRVSDVLFTRAHTHVLMAAHLGDDLHARENR